jgi:hypothetical protein
MLNNSGLKAGAFGGAALVAVLFFGSGIPRIQRDILQVGKSIIRYYESIY